MKVLQKDISRDGKTGMFVTCIAVKLENRSVDMLKAITQLYANVMDGLNELIETELEEFEGRQHEATERTR